MTNDSLFHPPTPRFPIHCGSILLPKYSQNQLLEKWNKTTEIYKIQAFAFSFIRFHRLKNWLCQITPSKCSQPPRLSTDQWQQTWVWNAPQNSTLRSSAVGNFIKIGCFLFSLFTPAPRPEGHLDGSLSLFFRLPSAREHSVFGREILTPEEHFSPFFWAAELLPFYL